MPSFAQPAGELVNFGRTTSVAGDQGKVCSHTTHNASVLLLFFVSRLSRWSQDSDSGPVSDRGFATRSASGRGVPRPRSRKL
jgi:hypothetical protein